MKTQIITRIASFLFAFSILSSSAWAEKGFDQPAVSGYDVVSYHQDSGPVRGSGYHVAEHEGATFLFATEANKKAFEKDPSKYVPAYNGYCAFGVSLGKKFNSDPTVYKIVDDVVYLNLDKGIQKKWGKDIQGNIAKANENWSNIDG